MNEFTFKYDPVAGLTPPEVVLKRPDYVHYSISKNEMSSTSRWLTPLIQQFDAMPFVKPCVKCGEVATRVSFYIGNIPAAELFCDHCRITSMGASAYKLVEVRTFTEAVRFAKEEIRCTYADMRRAVKILAKAKGLAGLSKKQCMDFLTERAVAPVPVE